MEAKECSSHSTARIYLTLAVVSVAKTYFNCKVPKLELIDFNKDTYLDIVCTARFRPSVMYGDGTGNFFVTPPILQCATESFANISMMNTKVNTFMVHIHFPA